MGCSGQSIPPEPDDSFLARALHGPCGDADEHRGRALAADYPPGKNADGYNVERSLKRYIMKRVFGPNAEKHLQETTDMDFRDIEQIIDETERIQKIYELFHEDTRLNRSKAARVEFLTNTRYIERYLEPGARILDIGAGAGEYSLYFARKGYAVCALELAENNIKAFRRKMRQDDPIELVQGNALDLSLYADEYFDIVLLFGPLYHLRREEDRQRCIAEARRVCRPGGKIFFAFISNDMVILTEFSYRPDYFTTGEYNKKNFALEDFPFVFHTVTDCREMLRASGIRILREVASDGVSELLEHKINAMDDENYAQYLRYHFYICEKPEFLGMTNHLLFVGEKTEA